MSYGIEIGLEHGFRNIGMNKPALALIDHGMATKELEHKGMGQYVFRVSSPKPVMVFVENVGHSVANIFKKGSLYEIYIHALSTPYVYVFSEGPKNRVKDYGVEIYDENGAVIYSSDDYTPDVIGHFTKDGGISKWFRRPADYSRVATCVSGMSYFAIDDPGSSNSSSLFASICAIDSTGANFAAREVQQLLGNSLIWNDRMGWGSEPYTDLYALVIDVSKIRKK